MQQFCTYGSVRGALGQPASLPQQGACAATEYSPLVRAMRTELKEARRCLSPAENRVLSLLYDLGLKTKEAARDLGVDEQLVWQIKRKALAKLRTRFRRKQPLL